MDITIDVIAKRHPIVVTLGIKTLDIGTRAIFEMYAKNVCQQLEWNNGRNATEYAQDGADKLLCQHSRTATIAAGILFAICVRQQLDWNNGSYATDVAERAAETILAEDPANGIEICQRIFNICIEQQLKWGNGGYAKNITDNFSDLIIQYGA